MSLLGLRESIVTSLKSEVATLKSVVGHGGRVSLEELRRIALPASAPAALVVVLGGDVEREGGGGTGVCEAQVAVFVACLGDSQTLRDAEALTVAEAVLVQAVRNAWDFDDAQAPARIRADNLFSGRIDRHGVALWAVRWNQRVNVGYEDDYVASLADFNQLHADWDLAPSDGVVDAAQDVWLRGTLMSAYGHLYVSSEAATAIAVVDTYQKAAGTTTLKEALEMDMSAVGRLRHTGSVSRPCLVEASLSVSTDGDTEATFALAKNGAVDADTEIPQSLTASGGQEAFSVRSVVDLDENDYVEVWVKADDTVNVTVNKMSLVAVAT